MNSDGCYVLLDFSEAAMEDDRDINTCKAIADLKLHLHFYTTGRA